MTAVQARTDKQFEKHALTIPGRELGLDGLARFLRVYRSGEGNYTAERQNRLAGITVANIERELNAWLKARLYRRTSTAAPESSLERPWQP